jgi:hypothetical protein
MSEQPTGVEFFLAQQTQIASLTIAGALSLLQSREVAANAQIAEYINPDEVEKFLYDCISHLCSLIAQDGNTDGLIFDAPQGPTRNALRVSGEYILREVFSIDDAGKIIEGIKTVQFMTGKKAVYAFAGSYKDLLVQGISAEIKLASTIEL